MTSTRWTSSGPEPPDRRVDASRSLGDHAVVLGASMPGLWILPEIPSPVLKITIQWWNPGRGSGWHCFVVRGLETGIRKRRQGRDLGLNDRAAKKIFATIESAFTCMSYSPTLVGIHAGRTRGHRDGTPLGRTEP
jgi:hypothetical protein